MLAEMKYRVKKLLGMPLPPKPHEIVAETDADQFGWYRRDRRELYTGFAIGMDDTFVDVGCGDGGSCVFAALCGAAKVIATDIDPRQIETVKSRVATEAQARAFEAYVSDSNPLPLASGMASKVVCQEVLEHVDDPPAVMAELVRIGQAGAQYLITVPDPVSESVQRHVAPSCYWEKPNHLRIFQREQFDRLVREAGLIIEARRPYSFFWAMWWALFWADVRVMKFGSPGSPVLRYWNKTWQALIESPNGAAVRKALDATMPKNQVLLARKPLAA
jgi:SAM-dependent methyltransferase